MKGWCRGVDGFVVLGAWVGGYHLVELLGAGAHGDVYLGRAASPWAAGVAVKVLRSPTPTACARLRQEASVLATIDHPNVVALVDLIDIGETIGLVTRYARGGSLADQAGREGFTVAKAMEMAATLSGALQDVHHAGLVHGDIKASNVLFTSRAHPLLADFGVAGWVGDAWSVGEEATAWFAPPERLGGQPADAAGDVYGLAACVIAALAAAPPLLRGARPPVACVEDLPIPSSLARVLGAAVATEPRDRFPSARAFAAALAASAPKTRLRS